MSSVDTLKKVHAIFKTQGGFKTGQGNWYIIDQEEGHLIGLNSKEGKVKIYQLGNGGTNHLESITLDDYIKQNSK